MAAGGVQLTKHPIIVGGQPRPSEGLLAASYWKLTILTSGSSSGRCVSRRGEESGPRGCSYGGITRHRASPIDPAPATKTAHLTFSASPLV